MSTHPLVTMRAKLEMGRFYLRARKLSEATLNITDALRAATAIWDAMPKLSPEAKTEWRIYAARIEEIAKECVSILNVWTVATNARRDKLSTGVLALALESIVGVVSHSWFQPEASTSGQELRIADTSDDDTGDFSEGI